MEICPRCELQWIVCDCEKDDIQDSDRIPFLDWPIFCARCGTEHHNFFHIPKAEDCMANFEIRLKHKLVCKPCWEEIKSLVENATYAYHI